MAVLFARLEVVRQFRHGTEFLMLLLHKIFIRIQPYRVHTTTKRGTPMFRATKAATLRNILYLGGGGGRGIFLMKTSGDGHELTRVWRNIARTNFQPP
jgi:hypothetical protein